MKMINLKNENRWTVLIKIYYCSILCGKVSRKSFLESKKILLLFLISFWILLLVNLSNKDSK